MPEDEEVEESEADEAEDEEYEMDYKAIAQNLEKQREHIGQLVQVVKNQSERLDALSKESPPEDDVEGSDPDPTDEEPEETIDEPDEDAATDGGENQADDTGDAMTKSRNIGTGSTPKPAGKPRGDMGRIQKAVSDGSFLRKAWQDGDIATVANAAASASRQACGRSNTGGIRKMGENDGAKQKLLKWIDDNLQMGVFKHD